MGLTSCGDQVQVTPPNPADEVAQVCESVHAALPADLAGEPERATDPESGLTASWGSPAITLRCGVGQPDAYEPTAQLVTVNGVDWFPEEREDGYVFTTWGRVLYVEVMVPDAYTPEGNALVDLAPAIKQNVPKIK